MDQAKNESFLRHLAIGHEIVVLRAQTEPFNEVHN